MSRVNRRSGGERGKSVQVGPMNHQGDRLDQPLPQENHVSALDQLSMGPTPGVTLHFLSVRDISGSLHNENDLPGSSWTSPGGSWPAPELGLTGLSACVSSFSLRKCWLSPLPGGCGGLLEATGPGRCGTIASRLPIAEGPAAHPESHASFQLHSQPLSPL